MRLLPNPKVTRAARVRRNVKFAARVEPLELRLLLSSGAAPQASPPSLVVAFDPKTPVHNAVTTAGEACVDGETNLKDATVWVGYGDGFYSSTRSRQPIKVGMHGSFSFDTPLWVGANTIVVAISSKKGNGAHQFLGAETLNLTRIATPGGSQAALAPRHSRPTRQPWSRSGPWKRRLTWRGTSFATAAPQHCSFVPHRLNRDTSASCSLLTTCIGRGIAVPMSGLFETTSGLVQIAASVKGRPLNQVQRSDPALAGKVEQQLRRGFVVDALLDNQDVIDHVVVDARGTAWRTDNGTPWTLIPTEVQSGPEPRKTTRSRSGRCGTGLRARLLPPYSGRWRRVRSPIRSLRSQRPSRPTSRPRSSRPCSPGLLSSTLPVAPSGA